MRIAVLIVRIIGIGLLCYGCYVSYMVISFEHMLEARMGPGFIEGGLSFGGMQSHIEVAGFVMAGIGLVITLFSARVCRWLTFDYKEKP